MFGHLSHVTLRAVCNHRRDHLDHLTRPTAVLHHLLYHSGILLWSACPTESLFLVCLYFPPSPWGRVSPMGTLCYTGGEGRIISPLWKMFPSPGNCWSRWQVPQDASVEVLQVTDEWERVPWSGAEDHSQRDAASTEGWIRPGTVSSPTVRV